MAKTLRQKVAYLIGVAGSLRNTTKLAEDIERMRWMRCVWDGQRHGMQNLDARRLQVGRLEHYGNLVHRKHLWQPRPQIHRHVQYFDCPLKLCRQDSSHITQSRVSDGGVFAVVAPNIFLYQVMGMFNTASSLAHRSIDWFVWFIWFIVLYCIYFL